MAHLKSFITRYSKVYIGLVLLIWIAFFFLPWDKPVLGISINLYQSLNHAESFTSFWYSVYFDGLAVQESQSLCFWTYLLSFFLDKSIYPICHFADFWQLISHKNQRG